MNKRKITALITALLFTACTPTDKPSMTETPVADTAVSTEASAATSASETSARTETSKTEETSAASAETTAVLSSEEDAQSKPVYSEKLVDSTNLKADFNEDFTMFTGELRAIELEGNDYPLLADALESHNIITRDAYDYNCKEIIDIKKSLYEDSSDEYTEEELIGYSCIYSDTVSRCDSKAFSIISSEEGFSGGVHGWYIRNGFNYDSRSGKELAVTDICNDIPSLLDILADKLEQDYSDAIYPINGDSDDPVTHDDYIEALTKVYGQDLTGYDDTWEDGSVYHMNAMNFVFIPDGVMFFTNQYDIAPYAAGTQQFILLFSENEGLFNEKYITIGDDFIYKNAGTQMYLDIDGDGKGKIIEAVTDHDDDWNITGYHISVAGKDYPLDVVPADEFSFINSTEFERKNGKCTVRLYDINDSLIAEVDLN